MKTEFESTFFDGISSKANKVNLVLEKNQWRIKSLNNSFEDIVWQLEKIQKPEVYTSGFYSYTYGEIPRQILEISNSELENALTISYPRISLIRETDSYFFKNKFKTISLLIVFLVSSALFSYFVLIPILSDTFVNSLNPKTVEDIGDFLFDNMKAELDINEDLSILMQDFADEIDCESEFKLKVKVSDLETVNAFAMPGGNILIYRGLLEKIENENQLLALLGHEFTHTTKRHVLSNLVNNLSGYFIISLFVGDANGIIAVVLENAHLLKQLSFTRELEKEADIEGIAMIEENLADPNGMHELFSIMNIKTDTSDHVIFDYLYTHPNMNERIKYTKELAENMEVLENDTLKAKWMLIKEEMYD